TTGYQLAGAVEIDGQAVEFLANICLDLQEQRFLNKTLLGRAISPASSATCSRSRAKMASRLRAGWASAWAI
ncbi:MAG: hypothetical protein MO852_10725, partial [Candidatus Devosia euplotis]|nr:hypothetical protein [Candidatus Devosia euplotis]